jgi:hypothetical protein
LLSTLGAVIKGYKVRRILKHNKPLCLFRTEYVDLLKFACQLKRELSESVRNGNGNIGQTKKLLVHSIKDLGQKREQFYQVFVEVYDNKHWL